MTSVHATHAGIVCPSEQLGNSNKVATLRIEFMRMMVYTRWLNMQIYVFARLRKSAFLIHLTLVNILASSRVYPDLK